MRNTDALYDAFIKAKEDSERKKLDYFINHLADGLENDLDKLYQESLTNTDEAERYQASISRIKNFGFRIYRNSEGKHKLI